MRRLVNAGVFFLAMGPVVACSELPSAPQSPVVTVGCANSLASGVAHLLNWELTVSTDEPVQSSQLFDAALDGFAVFSESLLDDAQAVIPGGVQGIDLVDLKATVHVRSGATGDDLVLEPEPIPYQCFSGRAPCDPANDLEGVAGRRGNTDCQPESRANPCGRFVPAPTSNDCDPGGVCASLNKTIQCDLHRFCITGDIRIPLQAKTQRYTADLEGEVLFGWADESTGAIIEEEGRNEGAWILPEASYEEPTGPVGARITFAGYTVALECAMGVDSTGPLGVDSADLLSSPTPDEALVSLSIEPERI